MITILTIVLIATLVAIFYVIRKRHMSILQRNGINGPKPNLITGNMFTFSSKPNVVSMGEYFKKYGETCGFYIGKKAHVLTMDPELVKSVMIKDFSNFSDRQDFNLKNGLRPFHYNGLHLADEKGARWKETRSILNPTFSAAKLKLMTPIIESAIDIFINKVDANAKQDTEFDIYDYFQFLTADVISKAALGVDTNIQNNNRDEFFEAAKSGFDTTIGLDFMVFTFIPELDFIFWPIRQFFEKIYEIRGKSGPLTLCKLATTAVQIRKNQKVKRSDLLQLMLDAEVSKNEIDSNDASDLSIDATDHDKRVDGNKRPSFFNNGTNKKKSLTSKQIIANAAIFYEAGYETTSTALGFVSYILTKHLDIQKKLREEINELHKKEGKFDYNSVNKLEYMQCVINETLRYYPPVTAFINRETLKDYSYKNIVIPKDSTVVISPVHIHHSEKYWPNPQIFDPERFRDMKKIDPSVFIPFGTGPRNCIGLRFALYEMKLALAKLLFNYRLVPGPNAKKEMIVSYKILTGTPKHGILVKAIPIRH